MTAPSNARRTLISTLICLSFVMAGCGGGNEPDTDALAAGATDDPQRVEDLSAQLRAQSTAGIPAPLPSPDESPSPRAAELLESDRVLSPWDVNSGAIAGLPQVVEVATGLDEDTSRAPDKSALAAAPRVIPIDSSDIIVRARADKSSATQTWGNAQCYGSVINNRKLPAAGIHGKALAGGKTARFTQVSDPGVASGKAFEFVLSASDPTTASSDRCEMSFPASAQQGIPRNTTFWHAFAVKLPTWAGTSDEQSIMQWHAGDTSGGLLPVYSLLVRGSTMRLVLRYDTSPVPSRASTKVVVVWSTQSPPVNRWATFVVQALVSPDRSMAPFVKTWVDGKQIVNYTGPVGYSQPGVHQYAKHGVYHWVDRTNPWNMAIPTRSVRLSEPMLIRDPQRKYLPETVRAFVEGRTS